MPPKPTNALAIALVLTYIGENDDKPLLDRVSQDAFLHELTRKNQFPYRSPNYGNTHHNGQSLRTAIANVVKKHRKPEQSASPATAARAQKLGKNDALVDLLFRYGDDLLNEDYVESVIKSLDDESVDVDEMLKGMNVKREDEEQTEQESGEDIDDEDAANLPPKANVLQDNSEDEDWKPNARVRRKSKSTKAAKSIGDRRKVDSSGETASQRPSEDYHRPAQQGNLELDAECKPFKTERRLSQQDGSDSDSSLSCNEIDIWAAVGPEPPITQQRSKSRLETSTRGLTPFISRKREGSPVAESNSKRMKTNDALPQPLQPESVRPGAKSLSKHPRTFTSRTTDVKINNGEDGRAWSMAGLTPYPEENPTLDTSDHTATTVAHLMRVVQKIPPRYQGAAGELIQEVSGAVEGFLDKIVTPIVFEPVASKSQPPRSWDRM